MLLVSLVLQVCRRASLILSTSLANATSKQCMIYFLRFKTFYKVVPKTFHLAKTRLSYNEKIFRIVKNFSKIETSPCNLWKTILKEHQEFISGLRPAYPLLERSVHESETRSPYWNSTERNAKLVRLQMGRSGIIIILFYFDTRFLHFGQCSCNLSIHTLYLDSVSFLFKRMQTIVGPKTNWRG